MQAEKILFCLEADGYHVIRYTYDEQQTYQMDAVYSFDGNTTANDALGELQKLADILDMPDRCVCQDIIPVSTVPSTVYLSSSVSDLTAIVRANQQHFPRLTTSKTARQRVFPSTDGTLPGEH